jgi:uncharacterized protein YybS (DUF2232 family)
MNEQNSTRALVESGILTAVAIILVFAGMYVPLVSLVASFLWPLPITFIYLRNNIKYAVISLVVTGIITAMFSNPFNAIYIVMIFGITSIVLGYCIKTKKSATITILYMSVTYFISIVAFFYGSKMFVQGDILTQFKTVMQQAIETTKNTYLSMGIPKEQIDNMLKQIPSIDTMIMLIPGTLVGASIVISFITYWAAGNLFKRFGYNLNRVKPFSEWYMPMPVAMSLIVLTFLGYILTTRGVRLGEALFFNSASIFRLAFTLIGLCSASYFLKKRGMSKPISVMILIFAVVTPIATLLQFLGIIDYAIDLRKLDRSRKRTAR